MSKRKKAESFTPDWPSFGEPGDILVGGFESADGTKGPIGPFVLDEDGTRQLLCRVCGKQVRHCGHATDKEAG